MERPRDKVNTHMCVAFSKEEGEGLKLNNSTPVYVIKQALTRAISRIASAGGNSGLHSGDLSAKTLLGAGEL